MSIWFEMRGQGIRILLYRRGMERLILLLRMKRQPVPGCKMTKPFGVFTQKIKAVPDSGTAPKFMWEIIVLII